MDKRYITGKQIKDMLLGAYHSFEKNYQVINDLNVFPVPDGDTGTNMMHTMASVARELSAMDDNSTVGEIGLAGEVRGVSNCEQRVREAVRLGFSRCIIPQHNLKNLSLKISGDTEIIGVRNIREAFEAATK